MKQFNRTPYAEIWVTEINKTIAGFAQVNYLRYLTYQGGIRAQIEGVRIHREYRHQGIGKQLIQFLITRAQESGCHLVQLTSDKTRIEALKFYLELGFKATHEGLKYLLK